MAMKKQERKESYCEIMNLMIEGNNKDAFDKLRGMCGSDTGLFVMVDYDEAMKIMNEKKTSTSCDGVNQNG